MESQPVNLIFQGGGVLGIMYAGAIQQMGIMGKLDKIQRVSGTSAGAIAATVLALGCNSEDAMKIIKAIPFKKMMDDNFGMVRDLLRLVTKYGISKGEFFLDWLGDLIRDQGLSPDITFQELRDAKVGPDLYVTATNLTYQKHQIFSWETSPDIPVRNAVRMSMSVPYFFKAVRHNGDYMVDGGLIYNLPIDLFDNIKYCNDSTLASSSQTYESDLHDTDPNYFFNNETLGFKINRTDKKQQSIKKKPRLIKNIFDYSAAITDLLYQTSSLHNLNPEDTKRLIPVSSLGVESLDFKVSEQEIEMLAEEGKNAVIQFFKKQD